MHICTSVSKLSQRGSQRVFIAVGVNNTTHVFIERAGVVLGGDGNGEY